MTADRYARIVQELIGEADAGIADESGGRPNRGAALAQRLADQTGVGYKAASVRAWIRGDAMPPAHVLVAAADLAGISVDSKLGTVREASEAQDQLKSIREELAQQGSLLAKVISDMEKAQIWSAGNEDEEPEVEGRGGAQP